MKTVLVRGFTQRKLPRKVSGEVLRKTDKEWKLGLMDIGKKVSLRRESEAGGGF